MTRGYWLIIILFPLAACGSKDSPTVQGDLRSDMPLRTTKYYMDNSAELAEMEAVCTAWKGSQRPPASWPSVVTENCGNVDFAKTMLLKKLENEKLGNEAGI